MKPRFFRSQKEFRSWLERNHATAAELWIGYHKVGSPKKGITYQEALDEALCYGWIDGKVRTIDELTYMQRWTPRKAKSPWSTINIARVGELKRLGLMTPAGLEAFERRDRAPRPSDEELLRTFDRTHRRTFRANGPAWEFFEAQPPGYRKNATLWVMNAKREETRERRLAKLIEHSANGERLPTLA